MDARLMKKSIEDYTRVMRGRYARRRGKQGRSVLLGDFCEVTGFERKYAIKLLRGQRRNAGGGVARGVKKTYTAGDTRVLKSLWLAAEQPCGKRLAGEMIQTWLGSWERKHGPLDQEPRSGSKA